MISIQITDNSSVGEARRAIAKLSNMLSFPEVEAANLSIIIVEVANNLVKHTPHGGEIVITYYPVEQEYGVINIFSLDKGPGITDIATCITDGYSTTGTPGTGLGAIKRLSSAFDIYSLPNSGSVLWSQTIIHYPSQKKIPSKDFEDTRLVDIGAISTPIKGEQVCGDGWLVDFETSNLQGYCMVVDGLGHGDGAFEASEEAIKTFHANIKNHLPLETLFQKIHLALHKTRGAAAAIAKINLMANELEYIGVGNISSVILNRGQRKSLVSLNGIVGHGMRKIQTFKYPLSKNFILIMHSDGIITHWDLEQYPGLLNKSANLIAGVMYRDYKRGRDDTTVVVMKCR